MTAAAFAVMWMKIKVEYHALIFCGLGGVFGIVTGKHINHMQINYCFDRSTNV